ncbi:MAG: YtxH domain-containing protein [Bacteroidota bacterium]
MSNKGSAFLAFLAGTVTGTVLGVLFAPDKGSNTRDKLSYQLDHYRKKLDELVQELVDNDINLPESEARSKGQQVITDAKQKAEKLLDDVDNLIGQIKNQ